MTIFYGHLAFSNQVYDFLFYLYLKKMFWSHSDCHKSHHISYHSDEVAIYFKFKTFFSSLKIPNSTRGLMIYIPFIELKTEVMKRKERKRKEEKRREEKRREEKRREEKRREEREEKRREEKRLRSNSAALNSCHCDTQRAC